MVQAVLTRKERQEQTREDLVTAAARVFARRGYHKAPVEEIAAERQGDAGAEAADQFRAFLEADPDWPLLFYEFWSLSVRNPDLQDELAKRRDAIRDALADTLERVATELGFELRFPAQALATAISASLNGLAFERAADPAALPDEVFAEFITAVLGCAISAPQAE